MGRVIAGVAFTALTACAPIPSDLGIDRNTDFGPPARAAAPSLWPCPDGWSESTSEGGALRCEPWPTVGHAASIAPCPLGWRDEAGSCLPWPVMGRSTCTSTEAHFAGEPSCRRIGAVCPELDRFAPDLGPDVAYVLAGAVGGDGSHDAPLGTIAEALTSSAPVIALGPGLYEGSLLIDRSVAIRGACAEETRLSAGGGAPQIVYVTAPGVTIRDLSLVASDSPGIRAEGTAELTVEGVMIEGVAGFGLGAFAGARVTARELGIRDIRPVAPDLGHGVTVASGSAAQIDGLVVERVPEFGLLAHGDGTTVSLTGAAFVEAGHYGVVVYRGAQLESARAAISDCEGGLTVQEGATARLLDLAITGSSSTALSARSSGSIEADRVSIKGGHRLGVSVDAAHLALRSAIVRDVDSDLTTGRYGKGIEIANAATAELSQVLVERCRYQGIDILDGANATLDQVTVRDMMGQALDDALGIGIEVNRASIALARSSVASTRGEGVVIVDPVSAVIEQLSVRDTREQALAPYGGFGLALVRGEAELRGISIEGSTAVGLYVDGATVAVAEDVVVEATRRDSSGRIGRGVEVHGGGVVSLARGWIWGNATDGVYVSASRASLSDVRIEGSDRGLSVYRGARVDAERSEILGSRDIGIAAISRAAVRAADLRVVDSINWDCSAAGSECEGRLTGVGIAIADDSELEAVRFSIARASLCGVLIGDTSGADLSRGDVQACEIGVCLLATEFDLARLQEEVLYLGNGVNLDAVELVLPALDAEAVLAE